METIPVEHGFILAGILFCLGLIGVLTRRNVVFVLMSLEIMLNASGLAFIVAAARGACGRAGDVPDDSDAGCGSSGRLELIIQMFRRFQTVDINVLSNEG